MNGNLLAIVKQITAQYGEDVLGDARRLKAFFNDLAKDESKPLRLACGRCLEAGAYTALKTAPDAAERALCKTAIAQRVRDKHGLDPVLCAEALDILEAALFGEGGIAPAAMIAPPPEPKPAQSVAAPATRPTAAPAPAPPPQRPPEGFVQIKGGTFTMGSPANEAGRFDWEDPQHQVTVSTFSMGKYEVTVGEFRQFVNDTGYKTTAETEGGGYVYMGREWVEKADASWKNPYFTQTDQQPVVLISWYDAVEYCNWQSQRKGLTPAYTKNGTNINWNRNADGCRLPTEAEWEYACRAGTTGPFNTGNNITASEANYNGHYPYNNNAKGTYREKTVEVGSFAANGWGLYDMHGNVWEWCWDRYGDYSSGSQRDPAGPYTGADRVLRGGSWGSSARNLRSAGRGNSTPSYRSSHVGFRLARP